MLIAAFVFIALAFPLYYVRAEPITFIALLGTALVSTLAGAITRLVSSVALVVIAIDVLLFLGGFLTNLGAFVLNWVISNPFTLSFTNPANNPVIELGWTLMRDLTNMFFILGLAYIGLATALDFAGFETKKVLPLFLLVALLVNFTPVICGIIVDISNLISNFFLQNADFASFGAIYQNKQLEFAEECKKVTKLTAGSCWGQFFALTSYGIFTGFILLLLAGILFIRHIAIWIFVIFSPIAFFAWIFTKTRKYASLWWKEFLKWSFVAVPLAFFLYLASYMLLMLVRKGSILTSYAGDPLGGLILELMPFVLITVFLLMGYKISKGAAPKLASSVMGFATGTALALAGRAGKISLKSIRKGARLAGDTASGAAQGFMKPQEGAGRIMGALKGGLTAEGRERGRETKEKFLERAHLVRPGFYEAQRAKRFAISEKEQKQLEAMSDDRLKEAMERKAVSPAAQRRQAAMAGILAKRNKFLFKDAAGNIDEAKERRFIERAQSFGVDLSDMRKSRPDLAPVLNPDKLKEEIKRRAAGGAVTPDIEQAARDHLIRQQIAGMTAGDFRNRVSADVLKQQALFGNMDVQKLRDIRLRGSLDQRRALHELTESGSQTRSELARRARAALNRGDREQMHNIVRGLQYIDDQRRRGTWM